MQIKVDIAAAELIDKITILEIKLERIKDPTKLANIRAELDLLSRVRAAELSEVEGLAELEVALKDVNTRLWDIEDDIRAKERAKSFDEEFIRLARLVYQTNDKRADLKRQINGLLNSTIVEEKSYTPY